MPRKPLPVDADGLRLCRTPGCGTRYNPRKEGSRGDCNRCRMARVRGQRPGARRYQPPGEAKVALWTSVRPELNALLTRDALRRHGVRHKRELLELALATLLGRPELVSRPPRRTRKET